MLLYLLFFKKIRHPLFIITSLTIGLAWTMGFVTPCGWSSHHHHRVCRPDAAGLADDFGVHFTPATKKNEVMA